MSTRLTMLVLMLAIMFGGLVGPAQAQEAQTTGFWAGYPSPVDKGNPYALKLASAKLELEKSINAFWAVYYANPWDYNGILKAYYRYASSYQNYVYVLRLYRAYSARRGSFAGNVFSSDGFWPRPTNSLAPDQIMRPAPVAGAVVTVRRNYGIRPLVRAAGAAEPAAATASAAAEAAPADDAQATEEPVAPEEESAEDAEIAAAQAAAPAGEDDEAAPQAAAAGSTDRVAMIAPIRLYAWRTRTNSKGRFLFRRLPRGTYSYTVSKDGFVPEYGTIEVAAGRVERKVALRYFRELIGRVAAVPPMYLPNIQPLIAGAAQIDEATAARIESTLPGAPAAGAAATTAAGAADRSIIFHPALTPVSGAQVMITPQIIFYATTNGGAAAQTDAAPGVTRPQGMPIYPGQTTTTDGNGKFVFTRLNQTSYRMTVSKAGYLPFRATVSLSTPNHQVRVLLVPTGGLPGPVPVPVLRTGDQPTTGSTLDNPFGN